VPQIVFEAEPQPETRAAILEGLVAFNNQQTEGRFDPPQSVALSLRDPGTGRPIGGLTARIAYSRMFIELLFVPEHLRGQGLGEKLMAEAEAVARARNCIGIWLDTFSFQAPGFYKRLGYTEFAEMTDYPPGSSRFFLQKRLD